MNNKLNVVGCESVGNSFTRKILTVSMYTDKLSTQISVSNGNITFSIPFEPLEEYLKRGRNNGKCEMD